MDTKLTLRLNGKIIERAKIYASLHRISLSKIIESYLDTITQQGETDKDTTITPLVESISGVINLPPDYDEKKDYHLFIEEKYQ